VSDGVVSRRGFYRSLKEQQPVEKRWKCDLRSNKLPWSIAAVTAIDELRRSCTAGDASEPQEGWRGSCEKTTCWDAAGAVRGHHQFESQREIYSQLSPSYELTGINQLWVPTSRTSG